MIALRGIPSNQLVSWNPIAPVYVSQQQSSTTTTLASHPILLVLGLGVAALLGVKAFRRFRK